MGAGIICGGVTERRWASENRLTDEWMNVQRGDGSWISGGEGMVVKEDLWSWKEIDKCEMWAVERMKGGWLGKRDDKLDGWQEKEKARLIKQEEDNKARLEGLKLCSLELTFKVPLLKIWFCNNNQRKKNQMIKKKMAVAMGRLRELQVETGGECRSECRDWLKQIR